MKKSINLQRGFTSVELAIVCVWLFGLFGWGWNIVKIVQSGHDVAIGMFVARCIGVFVAPIGSLLGYM